MQVVVLEFFLDERVLRKDRLIVVKVKRKCGGFRRLGPCRRTWRPYLDVRVPSRLELRRRNSGKEISSSSWSFLCLDGFSLLMISNIEIKIIIFFKFI